MYGSWDIKCKGQFFVTLGHLLPFDPPNNPKNQNLHGDIIILHMCTKNNNLMRCSSWDTEWDKKIFCHSGSFFAILTPHHHPTTTKTKILKTKNTIKWYMLTQIWSATDIFFVILSHFLLFLPDYWPWKSKVGKNVKNAWRY